MLIYENKTNYEDVLNCGTMLNYKIMLNCKSMENFKFPIYCFY